MNPLRFFSLVQVALVVPFVVFLVSPLVFYFGNHTVYQVSISDVFLFLLLNTSIIWVLLAAALFLSRIRPRLQSGIAGGLVGLAVASWLQSQILVWNFGPLDGHGLDWRIWRTHAVFELFLWASILTAGVITALRLPRAVVSVTQGLLALGTLSIFISYSSSDYEPKSQPDDYGIVYEFHSENNTLVIVLDTFQLDFFMEILENYEKEVEFLKGFTFYRNTVSGFPTTYPAVPLILTGLEYLNMEPILEFLANSYSTDSVTNRFDELAWDSSIIANLASDRVLTGLAPKRGMVELPARLTTNSKGSLKTAAMNITDGGLFRVVPTFLKERVYSDGQWWLARVFRGEDIPPGWPGIDLRFVRLFEENAKTGSAAEGTFKYFHFHAPHPPIVVDENLHYVPNAVLNRKTFIAQARGALTYARRILDSMKQLGVYESANILILADHGSLEIPVHVQNREFEPETTPFGIPTFVHSSGLPLMLHKPPGKIGTLKVSDRPMHLGDAHHLMTSGLGEQHDSEDVTDDDQEETRHFHFYDWSEAFWTWSQSYMPTIEKFEVRGHALNATSWSSTGIRYAAGGNVTQSIDRSIQIGVPIPLFRVEALDRYLVEGWSATEPSIRWTEGGRARIWFELPEGARKNLKFRLEASGMTVPGKVPYQEVKVRINGTPVATWEVSSNQWHQAGIPDKLVENGKVEIELLISDPTAPADFRESIDVRKLGLMARRFQVDMEP